MNSIWWSSVTGDRLAQGDMLPNCLLPVFTGTNAYEADAIVEEDVQRGRLIVITQSCDLENDKADLVALCPIHTLSEFEFHNSQFKKKGAWERVRKGNVNGLHLLASPETPKDNRAAYVVDFGHIVSLPIGYLSDHAARLGDRWRLDPPFLEHFSQALARFFMRVGLPSGIAPYK